MRQKKSVRPVHIVARYYIMKSGTSNGVRYEAGSVVLLVENDKGTRYYTTIRPNSVHSCSCPAKKTCYHITQCSAIEGAREAAAEKALAAIALAKEVENARAVKEVAAKLAREVEAICAEVEEATRDTRELIAA